MFQENKHLNILSSFLLTYNNYRKYTHKVIVLNHVIRRLR